jgi:YVTN family beta-propeller protein
LDKSVSVIDTKTNKVIDTIPVGNEPSGIAYAPTNGDIYVTDDVNGSVYVIDTTTNTIIDVINGLETPLGIAYDLNNKNMYVTNAGPAFTVSVIDTSTNKLVDTIELGTGNEPSGIAFDSHHGYMFVTNTSINHTVSVIDTKTNKVIDTIPVGNTPEGIAYNPNNKNMYVTNAGSNTVSVIATASSKLHGFHIIPNIFDLINQIIKDKKDNNRISDSINNAISLLPNNNLNNKQFLCNQLNDIFSNDNGQLTIGQITAFKNTLKC